MALLQLTSIPLGTRSTSVADYIAEIHQVLQESDLPCQLHDMGTIIEGNISELLAIIEKIYEIPFEKGAMRVITQITIDDRRDKKVALGDKRNAVEHISKGHEARRTDAG
ncbi:MAG: hypothetical protein C0613_14875 [Desulfobulbaceae bacterium]|nr:MAG: hypothetical protein C0613_14875 [Desulfobulbaceae bacterium]